MSFSRHFHSHKMLLLALLGLFTDRKNRFLYTLIYFTSEILTLSGVASPLRLLLGSTPPLPV